MEDAYIVAYSRSAFTKAKKGKFRFLRSDDLAIQIIEALTKKLPEIDKSRIDDLIVGCANPEGEQGLQIGRQIALRALGQSVPGITINRYCASGLEAIAIASAKIKAGMGHCYIAGGIESMSMIPIEGYKLALNFEVGNTTPDYVVGMGITAEAVAKKYSISREDQDNFSYQSHQKANKAQQNKIWKNEISDVQVEEKYVEDGHILSKKYIVNQDEGIRHDTSLASLAKLKPVFAKDGSVTAGNSSQTTDGAAFLMIVSESFTKQYNLKPIGKLISCSVAGVDPLYMGIGPCEAIPKALEQANISLQHIDLIELNEAFASQSLAVIKTLSLNPELVNIGGGAIALGHPLGCSGARLSMTLLNQLSRKQKKYGLVSACVGGGQGIAAVFENFL